MLHKQRHISKAATRDHPIAKSYVEENKEGQSFADDLKIRLD